MLEFIVHRLQSNYDWYVEDIRCLSSRCRKLETLNKTPILELWMQWLNLIPQYMSLIGGYTWLKRGLVNWKIDEKKYRLIQKAWKVGKLRKKNYETVKKFHKYINRAKKENRTEKIFERWCHQILQKIKNKNPQVQGLWSKQNKYKENYTLTLIVMIRLINFWKDLR